VNAQVGQGDICTSYMLKRAGNDSCFIWTLSYKWFVVLSGECTYKK